MMWSSGAWETEKGKVPPFPALSSCHPGQLPSGLPRVRLWDKPGRSTFGGGEREGEGELRAL